MSKPNNQTEAPTSGVTKSAAEQSETQRETQQSTGITIEQINFVNLLQQYYLTTGKIMPPSVAVKDYFFEEEEFARLRSDPKVVAMLEERDITIRSSFVKRVTTNDDTGEEFTENIEEELKTWSAKGLTPEQLITANAMLDLVDTKSEKKRLQDLGISTKKWDTWNSDPVFTAYMRDRAERMLSGGQHLAHLALLDRIRSGDLVAIKYYNELTERYVSNTGGNNGVTINNNAFDINGIITRIVEIVVDEVPDPQTAARISDRLKGLIGAKTVGGQIVEEEEPIIVPAIVKAKELSPIMQKRLEGENHNDS